MKKNEIDEIVLVGGSTRIPKIQTILSDFFEGKKLNKKLNPDEAVAYGATIQAAIQMGKYAEDIVLFDVCPFSLGIAVVNNQNSKRDKMEIVMKKGTNLLSEKKKSFYPSFDYQTKILFEVYEGEQPYVKDNYFLGQFILSNLPKKKRIENEIEVTFLLDENSILNVIAVEKNNKFNKNSITIISDKGGPKMK